MESTDASDGPVLNFVNKRIRGLRKKLNRILQIEEYITQGKSINKEQQELTRSKTYIVASIDELERLRQPLSAAVADEVDLAIQRRAHPIDSIEENTTADGESQQMDGESQQMDGENTTLEDLIHLIYFGAMFDVKSQNDFTSMMFTQMHERGSCLTYDYVTDDESADLLAEKDLDLISKLSSLLISRPKDSSLSHKNALQHCVEHAKLWLSNSDQPIDSFPSITYAGLRAKLNKIIASDYFTTTPKMKHTAEMAADAVANYGSFQVAVPVQVKTLDEDVAAPNVQGNGTYVDELGSLEGSHKEESELKDLTNSIPQTEVVEGQKDGEAESKGQQQYGNRRSQYQNQRGGGGRLGNGGGRRGSYGIGGRVGRGNGGGRGGGGPYPNGRNQFYDLPAGNINTNTNYPRNNHYNNSNKQRGGGVRGGAAYNSINHGAGNQNRYEHEDA